MLIPFVDISEIFQNQKIWIDVSSSYFTSCSAEFIDLTNKHLNHGRRVKYRIRIIRCDVYSFLESYRFPLSVRDGTRFSSSVSGGWLVRCRPRNTLPDVYFNLSYKRLLKKLSERREIKEVAGTR